MAQTNPSPAPPLHDAPGAGASAVAPRDLSGRTFADFKVDRLLGHGGMGEVYLARQLSLDRPVALKVLRPELLANPTHMARFEAEAWSAARLNHPNIVHIYALGEADGLKFIAMEYVRGRNLRDYLARRGPPELPVALSIMKQAASAVGAAGERGLVHRDIKPENLLLTREGLVKVADFGLCRTLAPDRANLTRTGVALGTPMYMSPEQVEGKPTDHRSDLYSLGVTFFHMLAGRPPFDADSPLALALKHVREPAPSLAELRPDLPADLVALVDRLIAKSPADRYQAASQMLADLARIRSRLQPGASMAGVPADEPEVEAPSQPVPTPTPSTTPTPTVRQAATLSDVPPSSGGSLRLRAAALLLAGLVAGIAAGAASRPASLLGPKAPDPAGPPGLWIADWRSVPARPTADGQYRLAQTGTPARDRPAAWLAVPGRHPESGDYTFRAYVQLARDLFLARDADHLAALAAELEAWGRDRPDSPNWRSLAVLGRAGAACLRGEPTAVHAQFQEIPGLESLDPGLAELGVLVVAHARRAPGLGPEAAALADLSGRLLEPLDLAGRGPAALPARLNRP